MTGVHFLAGHSLHDTICFPQIQLEIHLFGSEEFAREGKKTVLGGNLHQRLRYIMFALKSQCGIS